MKNVVEAHIANRQNILRAYNNIKELVERNNIVCKMLSDSLQKEINEFFKQNPRMVSIKTSFYYDHASPISVTIRPMHNKSKVAHMDDPISVDLLRLRTLLAVSKSKRFPKSQDTIYVKELGYLANEFQPGRLNMSKTHYEFVKDFVAKANAYNQMFRHHYHQLEAFQSMLDTNMRLMEGRLK